MSKLRVLFVDDEKELLCGLRRMLRGLRHEWEMSFVDSGEKALQVMAEDRFDAVVSDMQMPGMDGIQLLTEIRERYPDTLRIILSGQADKNHLLRAITPSHQYLSKPCDADLLKSTIQRTGELRKALANENLRRVVAQVNSIPSLPETYCRLVELLNADNASVSDVAKLIATDVGMIAKLMQVVNSSYFGFAKRISSPTQAVAMLGLDIVRPLVLSAGIFSQLSSKQSSSIMANILMEHCLQVSQLAERICQDYSSDPCLAEDAMLAGLLHDVGKLVLAANLSELVGKAHQLVREEQMTMIEAETEVLGANHAEVAAYLLGLWGLSDPILEAIHYHHQPINCSHLEFSPLTAVSVANWIVNEDANEDHPGESEASLRSYLKELGLEDRLPRWRSLYHQSDQSRALA